MTNSWQDALQQTLSNFRHWLVNLVCSIILTLTVVQKLLLVCERYLLTTATLSRISLSLLIFWNRLEALL